jgi:hypothetical protein
MSRRSYWRDEEASSAERCARGRPVAGAVLSYGVHAASAGADIAHQHKAVVYDLLFKVSAETMVAIAASLRATVAPLHGKFHPGTEAYLAEHMDEVRAASNGWPCGRMPTVRRCCPCRWAADVLIKIPLYERPASAGNYTIYGGSGDDIIFAGSGNVTVHGGSGDDLIFAGSGNA